MNIKRGKVMCNKGTPEEMLQAVNTRIDELEGTVASATDVDAGCHGKKDVEGGCSGKKKVEGATYHQDIETFKKAVGGIAESLTDPGARGIVMPAVVVNLGDGSWIYVVEGDEGLIFIDQHGNAEEKDIEDILQIINDSWADDTIEEEVEVDDTSLATL